MSTELAEAGEADWVTVEVGLCREHAAVVDKRERYEQFVRVLAEHGLLPTETI
jgi:hypothetical protein